MPSGLNLREHILAARARLAEQRERLRARHEAGSPGIQVCHAQADLVDAIVLEMFERAIGDLGLEHLRSELVLVPHGGYGRREMAPFSDVDLMLLCNPAVAKQIEPLAGRLLRDVGDAGLSVGHSVRTLPEALSLAAGDAAICTSLMESRYLVGSVRLYTKYANRFARRTRRGLASLIQSICAARREERFNHGDSVYMLEPNIKRAAGGLRDLQLIRWIGFACYGVASTHDLRLAGAMSKREQAAIRAARAFLLRLRNELHFHAGRSFDVLNRSEQQRVAERNGYPRDVLLPVEHFMRDYFNHTTAVNQLVERFVDRCRPGRRLRRLVMWLFSHQVERDFLVGPQYISATVRGSAKLRRGLAEVLRMCDLANLYDKPLDPQTRELLASQAPELPADWTQAALSHFRSLLAQPARLAEMLRLLHDQNLLQRVIPQWAHVRGLLQFNEYHQYTIDEHSLLAVQRATEFFQDEGPLGRVYRKIKHKWLLHLALLLHDLGKGHAEDHSEVGRRIALDVAQRLRLSESDTETVVFLVHQHLLMSRLAFRRDIGDYRMITEFAVQVGSPARLQMLFVLTAADLAAVGPRKWNSWKAEILCALYTRTMQRLSGDAHSLDPQELHDGRRAAVRAFLSPEACIWFDQRIESLPPSYLDSASAEQIAGELERLRKLAPGEVLAAGSYQPETQTVQYTVATHESIGPGIFHRLTGALAAKGLSVLTAEINTLGDGWVLDCFRVEDGDFSGEPPQERLDEVAHALAQSLQQSGSPKLHQARRYGRGNQRPQPSQMPVQVRIDNSTSERATIVDVFAADRTGLLYAIGRTLYELDLSVMLAKIGTYMDQVVDVFYVTDSAGRKIEDDHRVNEIRQRLLSAIENFERESEENLSHSPGA